MIIKIDKEINALKFHKEVALELHVRGFLDKQDLEMILDGLEAAIMVWEDLFYETKRNEYILS